MNLPALTEADIRSRATERSWERGLDYYNANSVDDVILRGGAVTAEVEGNSYEPYEVEITLSAGGITSTWCTCPNDWGGDCKHIIAVLLHLVHDRGEIEERPAVETLIEGLSREQLVSLVKSLASDHPKIIADVERFVQ